MIKRLRRVVLSILVLSGASFAGAVNQSKYVSTPPSESKPAKKASQPAKKNQPAKKTQRKAENAPNKPATKSVWKCRSCGMLHDKPGSCCGLALKKV